MRRGDKDLFDLTCSFDGDGSLCGATGDFHILFNAPVEGQIEHPGIACIEHIALARALKPFQEHPLMADCQMPGSYWDIESNRCLVPEDGDFLQVSDMSNLVSS